MKNVKISLPFYKLGPLFKRFHLTIFIILLTAALAGFVMLINNTVLNPKKSINDISSNTSGGQTSSLSQLESMHSSSNSSNTPAPVVVDSTNPFSTGR